MSALTKSLNEHFGLIGVIIAAILGLQVATDGNSESLNALQNEFQLSRQEQRHEMAVILKSVEELRDDSKTAIQRANMALWLERARRTQSLADLPDFPTN